MSYPVDVPQELTRLRQRAAHHLNADARPGSKWASPHEALTVLHQLASSPATAGDALALLHELQVHQVELDLQLEELREVRSELEAALNRQTALVTLAPAGYLTIGADTVVCETNLAGARLLDTARDDLLGKPLAGLLSPAGADALHTLLVRARSGLAPETGALQLLGRSGTQACLHAVAGNDTTPGRFLLVLMAAPLPAERGKP